MLSLRCGLILFLLPLSVCALWAAPSSGQIYVKADAMGANNGSSWTDAYRDLQDALAAAVTDDEIWVAAGTYYPTTTGDQWAAFTLKDSISLYGGFAGAETTVTERDIAANPTILSGEIGGPGVEDNSKSVVVVPTGTQSAGYTVDGFTVTGGNGGVFGGGIRNNAGDFTYANLIINGNSAGAGGGMYCTGQPTLRNVVFDNNSATSGGGLMSQLAGNPVVEDCQFTNNTSTGEGGGVCSYGAGVTLTRCEFIGNTAIDGGGGVRARIYDITDCPFDDNHATAGEGGAFYGDYAGTIRRCVFTNNTASTLGGAVHLDNSGSPLYVVDAVFENNQANFGGGLSSRLGSAVVSNAVFVGNTATGDGGAVTAVNGAALTLTNVSLFGNNASRYGGALNTINTDPIVTNVILWGNSAGTAGDEIYNQTGGVPDISYSIVQGSGGSGAGWDTSLGTDGGNNLDSDPMFVDPLTGNLRLQTGSPAIDHGSNAAPELQLTDLDGNTRILGGVVDMGAYEFDPATGVGDAPQLAIGLAQNYPNPFNPETVIRYTLPGPADRVDLVVYSVRGERVRSLVSGPRDAGPHVVTWDGRNDNGEEVGSGVYFYRLHTKRGSLTRRMVLLR